MDQAFDVVVRQRRQITLPADLFEKLGLDVGDRLELRLEGDTVIARAKKTIALDALKEIRRSFAESGISEEEIQEAGHAARSQIVRERYGRKA
jgi:AbrB family looped-hinge helix DNA binding protein